MGDAKFSHIRGVVVKRGENKDIVASNKLMKQLPSASTRKISTLLFELPRAVRLVELGVEVSSGSNDIQLQVLLKLVGVAASRLEYLNIVALSGGRTPNSKYAALGVLLKHVPQLKKLRFCFIESSEEMFMLSTYLKQSKIQDFGLIANILPSHESRKSILSAVARNPAVIIHRSVVYPRSFTQFYNLVACTCGIDKRNLDYYH